MASLATGFLNKKVKENIKRRAKAYEPQDPYYIITTNANGKESKKRRDPPPGLTKQQSKLYLKIARRAHYLDKGIRIGGFRFGYTFILGLIPGVGDAADAALNWFLVVRPAKNGFELPKWLVSQMLVNNAISAGVGLVPFAGDIMLAIWKANSRNAKLLEEYLRVVGEAQISQGLPNVTEGNPAAAPSGSSSVVHPGQADARADAGEVITTSQGKLNTSTASQATPAAVEESRKSRFSLRGRKN
ncbi:unnamed protein product [Tilletia controversa]|uniref:Uncharacterized protein n=1 Tax=Tilletia controversa TaxID=13291 RepID=A0A8X7MR53_9BASI|nr:hypothetical protein A4X06_0g5071 [Tilletia controversa]CAD6907339.1 unnamed protein product [Tilletia controversa]CAD6972310.1 unnamed protein product [Tilletia controversa]